MKTKSLLIIVLISALIMIITCLFFLNAISSHNNEAIKLTYVSLLADVCKIIIIGFFVSIAIASIPGIFIERKYEFEMIKSAKELYAETFTAIMYLPINLSYFKTATEALKYLEDLHKKKYLAETYHLDYGQGRTWPTQTDPGILIANMKNKTFKIADNWSNMSEKTRFDYFNAL